MATISFNRDWTLTEEQAQKLADILDEPSTGIITDEKVKRFEQSLKKGEELLNTWFSRCAK